MRADCKALAKENIELQSSPQAANQWRAFYVAQDMGLDDELTLALFEAVATESGWKNFANDGHFGPEDTVGKDSTVEQLAQAGRSMSMAHDAVGSDHASLGLLQQQVGRGFSWGSVDEVMKPEYAMRTFATRAESSKKRGDGAHKVAQSVQRSKYSDASNYREHEAQESALLIRLRGACR